MGPSAPTPAGFITVQQAADALGVAPYDVMRLIRTGDIQALVLVQTDALEAAKEKL